MNLTNSDKNSNNKSRLTYVCMAVMVALSLTQLIPSLQLAGIAVWVGLASFFVVEKKKGIQGSDSALRFKGLGAELVRRDVIILMLILVAVQLVFVIIGSRIFGQAYIEYDMGRAADVLNAKSVGSLLILVLLSSWGEEIAWRGFALGQMPKKVPFWLWAVATSALFALGHFSNGNLSICLFAISSNFVCSLIFTAIFYRTRNCMVSTVAHVAGNYAELALVIALTSAGN